MLVIYTHVDSTPKRIHLATAKDIDNIDEKFGTKDDYKRHSDDATSVKLWVDEMNGCDGNPVLLYDAGDLSFLMVLQSPLQRNLLKQRCSQSTICVDDTHGTNAYEFHLPTLMVIDEFGEGFPTAWCVSSHIDSDTLKKFFQAVKANVGELEPTWFMSDIADQFYNAWTATFTHTPKRILCTWHVLRAWKNHLKIIKDLDTEEKLYHILKVLMDETDEQTFKQMVETAVVEMKEKASTKEFGEYFEANYKCRCEQWANCFRVSSGVNTNMYVEAFHHILKYKFLNGKRNKRLDRLIHALMEFLRHKSFDRLIKFEKGKVTGRIAIIQKRHNASKSLPLDAVRVVDSCTYQVQSGSEPNEYTIHQLSEECSENCGMRCKECNICVHLYSCSCPDSILQHTICKHVHLIARYRKQDELPNVQDTLDDMLMQEITTPSTRNCESVQNRIMVLLNDISSLVQSSDSCEELKMTEKKLITIKNNLTAAFTVEVLSTLPAITGSSNKNVEKQRSFQSFKKKRPTKIRFGNPSSSIRKEIQARLLSTQSSEDRKSHFSYI